METIKRILIADPSEDFRTVLMEMINSEPDMLVVGMSASGEEALALARRTRPDVVVTDLVLTDMDGLGLLEALNGEAETPAAIVLSGFYSDQIAADCAALGVSYFIRKPCASAMLLTRMRQAVSHRTTNIVPISFVPAKKPVENTREMECVISDILHEIGIPAHLKGYHYIREAIVLAVNDIDIINAVTKILYPAVAKKYDSTASRVERAMRNAIETAWNRGNIETLQRFFGYTIATDKGKPTNSEFVAMIADWLILKEGRNMA